MAHGPPVFKAVNLCKKKSVLSLKVFLGPVLAERFSVLKSSSIYLPVH